MKPTTIVTNNKITAMKTKPTSEMKREYASPSVNVLELEYNGMLCTSDEPDSDTGTHVEEGETTDMTVYPGHTTSKPAL